MTSYPAAQNRHPELVSPSVTVGPGSIGQLRLRYRRHSQPNRQIHPMWIRVVNQINLPRPMPIFQLLLARNRGLHHAKNLKMHQPVNRIFGGMPGCHTAPMLRKPLEQVRRYADIKRTIMLACKYIYAWGFFVSHTLDSASKWTLKQVQGDAGGRMTVTCHRNIRHPELVSGSIGQSKTNGEKSA